MKITALEAAVGATAQILFSARILVQWVASERARKILSPVLFWQLSMIAAFMLCIYGWMRNDFAIVLGQLISYYVYIWNLNAKGAWRKIHLLLRLLFVGVPIAATLWYLWDWDHTMEYLFNQKDIPVRLIIFGTVSQFIFTFRFVYQWLYSKRHGESLLPIAFWIISLTGSLLIISYAVKRGDIIYTIGQTAGAIAYVRNIMIGLKNRRQGLPEASSADK